MNTTFTKAEDRFELNREAIEREHLKQQDCFSAAAQKKSE
jgi:hypothetical protein